MGNTKCSAGRLSLLVNSPLKKQFD